MKQTKQTKSIEKYQLNNRENGERARRWIRLIKDNRFSGCDSQIASMRELLECQDSAGRGMRNRTELHWRLSTVRWCQPRCERSQFTHDDITVGTWNSRSINKIMFKEHRVYPMLSLTLLDIFAYKYIWAITLTFQGHVMSLVMWPLDIPGAISYRCFIVTESVSKAIFDTIGPTTLTFQGHVTSSVTWPINSSYAISKLITGCAWFNVSTNTV